MFTQGAALGYVIVGLSARLRPHYQFYRTAIKLNSSGGLWPPQQAAMLLVETIWLGAAEAFTSATVRVKKSRGHSDVTSALLIVDILKNSYFCISCSFL